MVLNVCIPGNHSLCSAQKVHDDVILFLNQYHHTLLAVHIEYCDGWWLSSYHSSVVVHWRLKPGALDFNSWWLLAFHFPLFLPHTIKNTFFSNWGKMNMHVTCTLIVTVCLHHMADLHICANSPMTWEIVYSCDVWLIFTCVPTLICLSCLFPV